MKELSQQYLSEFCMELALFVRAGVPLSEGLQIMRDDENDTESRKLLDSLFRQLENETLLSNAIEASSRFPSYFLSTIRLGERSGRLDDALSSLSVYYERQVYLSENIKRAVIYPVMLVILIASVVVVVVTQILPVFNQVFNQVGVQMSGASVMLINLGKWLASTSSVLLTILIAILITGMAVYRIPSANRAFLKLIEKRFGDRGILKRISISRFAMAMSMAVSSGLDAEQAISLAGDVCGDSYNMEKKVSECKSYIEQGESLENSLLKSHIFLKHDSRLLALASKTGSTDRVMSEIARRSEEKVVDELDEKLKKIEPTLVVIISLIVGLILFSVMLPLMGIMSSIG